MAEGGLDLLKAKQNDTKLKENSKDSCIYMEDIETATVSELFPDMLNLKSVRLPSKLIGILLPLITSYDFNLSSASRKRYAAQFARMNLSQCREKCPRELHRCTSSFPCEPGKCPPCIAPLRFKMTCLHIVDMLCYEEDPDEESLVCYGKCRRGFHYCSHPCDKICWEVCGVCEKIDYIPHPGCGHLVIARCSSPIKDPCEVKVIANQLAPCGHEVNIPCKLQGKFSLDQLLEYCNTPCREYFDPAEGGCGHYCQGTCRECHQKRLHIPCAEPCEKILVCGHVCTSPCSAVCPPCGKKCDTKCPHKTCHYECGIPCEPCKFPCEIGCVHAQCINFCSEACSILPCDEACEKTLDCGHQCLGLCGEPCPRACLTCGSDALESAFCLLDQSDVDETTRFVMLPDCGHILDKESMDSWMKVEIDRGEIRVKVCPLCKKTISYIPRYASILWQTREYINKVKRRLRGSISDIVEYMRRVKKTIDIEEAALVESKLKYRAFHKFLTWECSRRLSLQHSDKYECCGFYSMSLSRAKCLVWLAEIWRNAEQMILMVPMIDPDMASLLDHKHTELFDWIECQTMPLKPAGVMTLMREEKRLTDVRSLIIFKIFETMNRRANVIWKGKRAQNAYQKVIAKILDIRPYDETAQEEFQDLMKNLRSIVQTTLNISEEERINILGAFGYESGRWFKCPNGHIYVITECGGPTEESKCNECGARVGSFNHYVGDGNNIATEMDGAELPRFPTALDPPVEESELDSGSDYSH